MFSPVFIFTAYNIGSILFTINLRRRRFVIVAPLPTGQDEQ